MKHTDSSQEVIINDLSIQMNGHVNQEQQILEVPCTLPGEHVIAKPVKKKGRVTYALLDTIKNQSKQRIPADCKHFGHCGACHLRHVSYEDSILNKQHVFFRELHKALPENTTYSITRDIIASPVTIGYRNTVRFYLKDGRLSQHTLLTHELFDVEECHVIPPYILAFAKELAKLLPQSVSHIELRYNHLEEILLVITTPDTVLPHIPRATGVFTLNPESKQITHLQGQTNLVMTMCISDHTFSFEVGPSSFFQVNTAVAEMLYEYINQHTPKSGLILDLYAGTGTIGIILARLETKRQVISMEISEEMTALAQKNAISNGVDTLQIVTGDVRSAKFSELPRCIVVDPPRNGLSSASIEHLVSLGSEYLIYVSCSPQSLFRDIGQIMPTFSIEEVQLFDMMPYTSQIESIVVFRRR